MNCKYCKKECKTTQSHVQHEIRCKDNPDRLINANNLVGVVFEKYECQYCSKLVGSPSISRHEKSCFMNPENLKICPVCESPIKHYKDNDTCSYGCANTLFRSGANNGQYKSSGGNYRSICFLTHGKKCIVCGEEKIVAVHHMNENHEDHRPENLIPLCPTHHVYIHSKYREEILPIVEKFIRSYLSIV